MARVDWIPWVKWIPRTATLQQQMTEEMARLALKQERVPPPAPEIPREPVTFAPIQPLAQIEAPPPAAPVQAPPAPTLAPAAPPPQVDVTPTEQLTAELKAAVPDPTVPFWQRALQVFGAPFDWTQENIINPGLQLARGALDPASQVERRVGEDFWEWQKRSWETYNPRAFVRLEMPWGDWDINLKGVLEFAPWLFIPGAGQVGVGARAARGIAGVLGKFGKAGQLLGTAVEFSPWGLVDKTVGVVSRAAIKGAFRGAERISAKAGKRAFGEFVPPEMKPTVAKFAKLITEEVEPKFKAFKAAEKAELRPRQIAGAEEALGRGRTGEIRTAEEAFLQARKAQAGGIKQEFVVRTDIITQPEMEDLLQIALRAEQNGFIDTDVGISLIALLKNGTIPEPRMFREFARVYGTEFGKAIKSLTKLSATRLEKFLDILNIPRAMLSSTDISAVGRQGLILGLMDPRQAAKAFPKMIKALFSEKAALEMNEELIKRAERSGFLGRTGYISPMEKLAAIAKREESFASGIAESIPFVRRSQRAFNTYMNEIRVSSYENISASWIGQGATEDELTLLAQFVNVASGRGTLPKSLDKYAPMLNAIIFSPRLQAANIQLPKVLGQMLFSNKGYMRKEAGRALVTFLGGGAALLYLLDKSDFSSVEMDPRASGFGKIKIGDTRFDIWRGYLQYTRFVAQLLTGERKSAYGNLTQVQRSEIAFRFLQSKASPAFGLIVDLMKGENYLGEELFVGTTGLLDEIRNRVMPLAIQDMIDAIEQSGMNGAFVGIPASLGIGTVTYVNELVRTQNRLAQELGAESWGDLDPKSKRTLQNTSPELQAAMIEFDRAALGTTWGDYRLNANAIEDEFAEQVDQASADFRQNADGPKFRDKVDKAFNARRSAYDVRDRDPRFAEVVARNEIQDETEALVKLGPQQLAINLYNKALYGDDMVDEFGDYRYDEAEIRRTELRAQLGQEMYDYVESFRALKFDNLPPEYQELVKAKEVMRPYWAVEREYIRIRGKPQTAWQVRRLDQLIARERKRLRRMNPEIAYWYSKFYTRPE